MSEFMKWLLKMFSFIGMSLAIIPAYFSAEGIIKANLEVAKESGTYWLLLVVIILSFIYYFKVTKNED